MHRHIRLNSHRFFETITYWIVNVIMLSVLVIHGWHYLVSEAKATPAATRDNQQTAERATDDSDEESSVPINIGTGDHTPSKSTSSRLHQRDKGRRAQSCNNRMCCRAGK